VVVTAQCDATI